MQKYRVTGAVLALALLAACAPKTSDGVPGPGPQQVNNVPEELMEDRGEFLAAWARDDFEEVATSFTTDAMVEDGELRARGAHEVQAWLTHQLDECMDLRIDQNLFRRGSNAIDEEGRYTMIERHGTATGTYEGEYHIRWVWDGDDYIVDRLEFHPGA